MAGVVGTWIEIRNRFAMLRNRFFDFPGAPGLCFASLRMTLERDGFFWVPAENRVRWAQ